eukprot:TRINITY_DN962_c0_g1_i1.p1 TRINITY_DN962_c0_g1~~TRINITY_DN962_c0_g1_i1.p1  ORF type:complete len:239 (+),score=61.64 TRINITY_DN962_c0_g1_i1:116-832(+)
MKCAILALVSLFVALTAAGGNYPYAQVFIFDDNNCETANFIEAVALDTCIYNATLSYDDDTDAFTYTSYGTFDCSGPATESNTTIQGGDCRVEGMSSYFAFPLESYYAPIAGLYTYAIWTGRDESGCDVNAEALILQYTDACVTSPGVNASFYISCSSGSPVQYSCTDDSCENCTTVDIPTVTCQKEDTVYTSMYCTPTDVSGSPLLHDSLKRMNTPSRRSVASSSSSEKGVLSLFGL